ncbi:cysteine-rich venom protein-like [Anas platyrhynchos]|uniref:Cysteine rich secretory protein 2 n=2 Tax=Anas TaxID=8835 RepID=A0A493T2U9_ANAPP|nr:cysteine-rich venom protein-like [Anas platyrhynchos]
MGPITAVLCLVALIHQAEAQVYQSKQVDTPLFPPFPVKYPIQKPVKKPIQKPIYKPVQKPIHKQIPIQKPVQLPPIKKPVQVPAIKKPVYVPPVKKPVYVPPVKKPVYVPPVKKPARLPPIKKPQQPQQPQQPAQQKYNGFQMQSKQQMLQQQNIIQLKNKQVILKEHNQIRRSVVPTARNMLKMVWNERAAKNAQKWAKKCEMEISPTDQRVIDGITCGENILLSSQPKTWAETIQVWNSQGSNFKYGFGATTKNANVKSYAQLVWYNSYQVGCAVAYCPRNQYNYFYVCHYCPPGNNIMQVAAPYKSGPRCADCPGHCDNGLCTNPCRHRDAFPNCKNMRTLFGCRHPVVREKCAATCKCTTQIV